MVTLHLAFSLALILGNTSGLLYELAIKVVYGFGIRLRGMCEVTPSMETTSHGISQDTTLCSAISLTTARRFDLHLKCGTYVCTYVCPYVYQIDAVLQCFSS